MPSAPTRRTSTTRSPVVFYHDYTGLAFIKKPVMRCGIAIYAKEKIPVSRKTHVILCSDYKIRKLNAMFRHTDRPTDVLSFNYDDDDILGEIYISLQRAEIQARRYKVSYGNELVRLFVHGMFHLLGYDHETAGQKKKMALKEALYCH